MEFETIIKTLLQNNTEEDLVIRLLIASSVNLDELLIWELLLYAVKIEKNADFLLLDEKLAENSRVMTDEFKKQQIYNTYIQQQIMEIMEEETVCSQFKVSLIKEAFRLGLFPMSVNIWNTDFLTFRHHSIKTIITFDQLHIPKKTGPYIRKDFSRYTMTFNRDFHRCMQALTDTYKETWLCPKLIQAYEEIHQRPTRHVSVDSIEIWNAEGDLVAGEIGFMTGNTYASLTGFHKEKNIGTVQMSLLGLYLKNNGFAYWDLGMSIPYKYRFGAIDCDREQQSLLWSRRKKTRNAFPEGSWNLLELWETLTTTHPTM